MTGRVVVGAGLSGLAAARRLFEELGLEHFRTHNDEGALLHALFYAHSGTVTSSRRPRPGSPARPATS